MENQATGSDDEATKARLAALLELQAADRAWHQREKGNVIRCRADAGPGIRELIFFGTGTRVEEIAMDQKSLT